MTTYIPLASQAITSSTFSVTFSNISQAYNHLEVHIRYIASATSTPRFWFNSNNNTVYWRQTIGSNTTTPRAASASSDTFSYLSPSYNNNRGSARMTIMNYAQTTYRKVALTKSAGDVGIQWGIHTFADNAAISSISFDLNGASFENGTFISIYGVA